jgi:hypothetical protein
MTLGAFALYARCFDSCGLMHELALWARGAFAAEYSE